MLEGLQPGDVLSYGEVAAEAGYPGAARAVGTFLRDTELDLPWWRVVGAGGILRSPKPGLQARLLGNEAVDIVNGRVKIATGLACEQ